MVLVGAFAILAGIIGWFVSPLIAKHRWFAEWFPPTWYPEESVVRRLNRVGSIGMIIIGLVWLLIGLTSN